MRTKSKIIALASLLLVILTLLALSCSSQSFQGTVLDPPETAPSFTLTDQFSNEVSLSDFRGKVVVLTFLFTNCTDVCPLTALALGQAHDQLDDKAREQVQFLAITVDPERDTVERVYEYSKDKGMLDKWRYLVGTKEELVPLWKNYWVGPIEVPITTNDVTPTTTSEGTPTVHDEENNPNTTTGNYDVIHEAPVFLIDQRGYRRVVITSLLVDPAPLLHDLRILLR